MHVACPTRFSFQVRCRVLPFSGWSEFLKLVFPFTLSSSHFTLSLWVVWSCRLLSLLLSHCSNIVFSWSYSTRKIRCHCSCSAVICCSSTWHPVFFLHSEGPNSTPSQTKYRWAYSRMSPSRRLTSSCSNDKKNYWLRHFNWIAVAVVVFVVVVVVEVVVVVVVVVVIAITSVALNLLFKGANPCTKSYWLLPT